MEIKPLSDQYVDKVAKMHLDAFTGHLNILLGFRYIKTFLRWFYLQEDTLHFVVVERENVLGYVVGAPWGYQTRLNKYLLKPGIIAILLRPWVIFNRWILNTIWLRFKTLIGRNKHIQNRAENYTGKMVSLVGIAVSTEARGRKLGNLLIDTFEKAAINQGFDFMRLSVYRSNKVARAFYEKNGWTAEEGGSQRVMGYYKNLKK